MLRTRVKICGITTIDDALHAVDAGVDAIGLVLYPGSPRYVNLPQAISIVENLPPLVAIVALCVNAERQFVEEICGTLKPDYLQFHGDESPAYCQQFGHAYIKALRVRPDTNLVQCGLDYAGAKALLLDAYVDGAMGGTGQTFDWGLIPVEMPKPVILAGGLSPENVRQAIEQVKPYAVDVSGGVERVVNHQLIKGSKDPQKMRAFMRGVNHAVV